MLMAQELKNPWEDVAVNPASSVLALFEDNPFGSFEEMFFEQKLEWEPYERTKLLEDLSNNPASSFDVRGRKQHYFEGSIARHQSANTVSFKINPDYLATPDGIERALAYLGRWLKVLPRFTRGKATADLRPSEYFFNQGLEPLPEPFGSFLGWYTLMSRRGYEPYFALEDLLKTPAHRVEELPDAAVAITAYPDPFNFESTESHRKIVELTHFLNERRKDRK
ncbi:MAG TPA: hypothetical protein VKB46_06195 [Pyrinomonadaceae bacterium]|nr:hypothetical protein [Pyrinomonadaceae bacterium]